ncbi:hypothetical protein K431DRAFT_252721, partial [Polychaeton citri CBS 116435]
MAPRTEAFSPAQLEARVQFLPNGKLRKGGPLDLKKCRLEEMLQYNCELDGPKRDPRTKVVCQPVLRLFRRQVTMALVKTTSWEGVHDD